MHASSETNYLASGSCQQLELAPPPWQPFFCEKLSLEGGTMHLPPLPYWHKRGCSFRFSIHQQHLLPSNSTSQQWSPDCKQRPLDKLVVLNSYLWRDGAAIEVFVIPHHPAMLTPPVLTPDHGQMMRLWWDNDRQRSLASRQLKPPGQFYNQSHFWPNFT